MKLALPTGRMKISILELLADAGINVVTSERSYTPKINLPGYIVKILKPQSIAEMLHRGSRDLGFTGADWVKELKADLIELVDTKLDPVSLVVAAPEIILEKGKLPKRNLLVASEYEMITRDWIEQSGLNANYVRSFGATEVFPPEDADCIVDNTATGATLKANSLEIVEIIGSSSTRLYASNEAMKDPVRRKSIEHFVVLVQSVLEARERVMIEVNVDKENLEAIIRVLPSMREPTVSQLRGDSGYAVKAAVRRLDLPQIISKIKMAGGEDILVVNVSQIIP